ncbi:cleavage and polyadenylation specificity factor subunit 2-like [Homarus americanus]|uniref:Cleavage and polyadenylation specificity factor subunit 2 n=1 Tax=Homarus americanus TaxID=6706 RepID=A0A8J5K0L0_HOMAM|nr:cleavage and polyadenylation specificity factor subunit 2-like [Homarus americanus]
MTSIVKFEGVWGVGDETPHCYLLTVDDFTFLLDCGWDEKFDKAYIDRLANPIMDSAKKSGGVKRKHRALSIAEKVEVLKKLDSGVSVRTICETYSIGSSTVYDIKKKKEKLLKFFSDNVTNPDAKEPSSRINEDVLTEWLDVDDNVPTVHHYTDSEIVDMVKIPERNACTSSDEDESSEENEEDVRERISIDRVLPRVDCVLISYPDPLHMGALPFLVGKCQLSCPVYATIPVFKMGQMFMYDWFQSHHNYDLVEHFTLDDVDSAFELITQVKYNQSIPMRGKGIGLNISAQPAGHMIGGSIWRILKDGEGDIVYAVDFNHKKERHLGGCELDKISRPSLLITDAFNASYRQERRRHRDEKLVGRGGNVLVATDTGGRVLEMTHMLEQMWSTRESGLSAYSLCILSNTGYHVIHFAKQMIEWMSEKLTKAFDSLRTNPFSFKHLKFCHNLTDLSRLPSPKVVLASFPDLECGYARELFVQWATNPKNTIILTSRTGPDTLARRLIDNPQIRTFKLLEKRRMKLEGPELDEHYRQKREEEQQQHRIKMEEVESSSDSEGEEGLEAGKHDIIVLHEKAGTQRDDYGEFINLEDFDIASMKEENKENLDLQIPYEEEDIMDMEEVPSKCVSQTVTVRVAAQVLFIDFEGRSDGESIRKIVESMHPLRVILVRGSQTDLLAFSENIRSMTRAKVFTPSLGQVVNASMESHIYQIKLAESLVSSLMLQPAGRDMEVAWVDGCVSFPTENINETVQEGDRQVISSENQRDSDMATLRVISKEQVPFLVLTRVGGTRWLPHMLQALEHLLKSYKTIVLHMQQIQNPDDPAYHKNLSRKAKNYLLLLTSANIVQYLHLLLDVVRCLSELFGQTNISAILNEIQTVVDVLNKYLTWPGPSLRRIMEGDSTMFQGEKLSGRSNTFETARHDMLTSPISSLNKRFIDMASTILQNAWILNFKLWPAEYSGNGDFGDSAVQALAQALEKTLMEAEVNPTLVEDEWTMLKSYIYKSKTSLVSRLSWQQINQSYRERCASFLHLVDLLLSSPASSTDAECGFRQVKLIKTDWRSRLTDDHLTDLMVVQLQTECVGNFNPDKAIARFLTTGARRVDGYTHTAGCSTVEDLDDNNELNEEHALPHIPVFINDIRLSEFKQVLSRAGISSEFNAGILWCANGTLALKKQDSGSISLEGPLSQDYYEIRELLYSQYAIFNTHLLNNTTTLSNHSPQQQHRLHCNNTTTNNTTPLPLAPPTALLAAAQPALTTNNNTTRHYQQPHHQQHHRHSLPTALTTNNNAPPLTTNSTTPLQQHTTLPPNFYSTTKRTTTHYQHHHSLPKQRHTNNTTHYQQRTYTPATTTHYQRHTLTANAHTHYQPTLTNNNTTTHCNHHQQTHIPVAPAHCQQRTTLTAATPPLTTNNTTTHHQQHHHSLPTTPPLTTNNTTTHYQQHSPTTTPPLTTNNTHHSLPTTPPLPEPG